MLKVTMEDTQPAEPLDQTTVTMATEDGMVKMSVFVCTSGHRERGGALCTSGHREW